MSSLATWAFVAVVAALLAEGLIWRDRCYQFPFLAAAMAFAFIVPQAPGVAADPFLPAGGYVKVCIIAVLCLLFLRLGWRDRKQPIALFEQVYSESRLLIAAALLSAVGAYFYIKISHLPSEMTIGVQMSGAPVVYLFFARLLTYGLAIATLCFARSPSIAAGSIALVDLIICLDRVLITGKRAEALELVLILALALWFQRRVSAPRSLVFAGLILGAFAMNSMADYREITRRTGSFDWESIRRIDVAANFEELLKSGGPELRNAVVRVDTIDRNQMFDYGTIHWNRLVFNYVPAQLFGRSVKDSLMLTIPPQEREYQPLTGTTETGMVDAFQSFWYFGSLKFLVLSLLIANIWSAAQSGSTTAQLIYILSIVPAMHAVSHLTDWIVSVWVHMLIFLLPALIFARAPKAKRAYPATPAVDSLPSNILPGSA